MKVGELPESQFDAHVVAVHRSGGIVLDRTAFVAEFPGSEGLAWNCGLINGSRVARVWSSPQGKTVHMLEPTLKAGVGAAVVGEVDISKRYQAMQLHTAGHLVELAVREINGAFAGLLSHPTADTALLKLQLKAGALDVTSIERWVNRRVREDLPMLQLERARSTLRRSWHLHGFGHRPCLGIHVQSTGEIGQISVAHGAQGAGGYLLRIALKEGADCGEERVDTKGTDRRDLRN